MDANRRPPTSGEVNAALQRVLAVSEIGRSPRLSKLLRYLVEQVLAGEENRLKGTTIALDVFDRGADFDPQTDGIVRSEARRLRQALATYYQGLGADDGVVITVPKGSYVPQFSWRSGSAAGSSDWTSEFAVEATRADPASALALSSASAPVNDPDRMAPRQTRSRSFVVAASALIGIAAVATLAWSLRQDRTASVAVTNPAVLVEPFLAAGTTEDIKMIAPGMTAQLIADLMQFTTFRLYSFEDSLRQQNAPADGQDAPVKADYVVSGVVSGGTDSLSISVRLVAAQSGEVVWSETYLRPLAPDKIADMEGDISGEIAAKIGAPYGVIRSRLAGSLPAAGTAMSSFDCVMRGHVYRYGNRSDLYGDARSCLEAAVVTDPGYAEAWALLAFLRLDGGRFWYDVKTPEEQVRLYDAAREAAAQALTLQPGNVLAMSALAMIEHYAGNFDESLRYSRLALDLNPNDPSTLGYHGWRLVARSNFKEGVPFVKRAIERSANPQPTFFHVIALDRMVAKDWPGMLDTARKASADGSSVSDAFLAIAYGGLGEEHNARKALADMAEKWPFLAKDPAAAFGMHKLDPDLIRSIVAGLEKAGWKPPAG